MNQSVNIILTTIIFLLLGINSASSTPLPQKLVPNDAEADDSFGQNLSLSGDFSVISSRDFLFTDAYIFEFVGSKWVEKQKLIPSDREAGFFQTIFIDIHESRLIIGSPHDQDNGILSGAAYIFEYNGTSWIEMQKVFSSDISSGDGFGGDVIIRGDIAFVGGSGDEDDDLGAVYVFEYNGQQWIETQKIVPPEEIFRSYFGDRLMFSDGKLFVRSWEDESVDNHSGSVFIFEFDGQSWVNTHKLAPSNSLSADYFGNQIAVSRNRVVIGTPSVFNKGAVYIYEYDGSTWNETARIEASDAYDSDYFGISVGTFGNSILVGADTDDIGESSGSVYFFEYDGLKWNEVEKIIPTGTLSFDFFGRSMKVDNAKALIGSYGEDDSGDDSGSAFIYDFNPIFSTSFE